nr:hypothetical protein [Geomicrobium sp. JCM 19055]
MDEREMMTYGKGNVFAYRTFMEPVVASRQIPESSFKERDNTVFGLDVTVEVGGRNFYLHLLKETTRRSWQRIQ